VEANDEDEPFFGANSENDDGPTAGHASGMFGGGVAFDDNASRGNFGGALSFSGH